MLNKKLLKIVVCLVVIYFLLMVMPASGKDEQNIIFESQDYTLIVRAIDFIPGELLVFKVIPRNKNKMSSIEGTFLDTKIEFYKENHAIFALSGLPTRLDPGTYNIKLISIYNDGTSATNLFPIKIKARDFKVVPLTVDPYYLKYTDEQLQRIKKEAEILKDLWATVTEKRYWEGLFIKPVDSEITLEFGAKREFNGEYRSTHSGTDSRAEVGTEVHAANDGSVVMCDDFFFSGKFIVIDHGRRVYSFYAHLSQFKVSTGQFVKKGTVIALSGDTGRVTGPHLHWTMKVNSVNVEPISLTSMNLYE